MQGLVSILPQPYYDHVLEIWDDLEAKFGLKGIRVTPLPHFTWQVADQYQVPELLKSMRSIAANTPPMEVCVKSAEAFVSDNPVVFLKVLKSAPLLKLHFRLWLKCLPIGKEMNMLYSPPLWRPHISLAYQDLTRERLKEVLVYM